MVALNIESVGRRGNLWYFAPEMDGVERYHGS
jgi:hypothetical protein